MHPLVRYHPRIWIAALIGVVIFFFLPAHWSLISRILVSWNCGVVLFLALIYVWMIGLTAKQICSRYIEEDSSAPFILIVVTLAALLSLIAIVEPLGDHQSGERYRADRALRARIRHLDQLVAAGADDVHDLLCRHVL